MSTSSDFRVVTKGQMMGTEKRWRRFGEPTPAGESLRPDGTPDYGVFGPGTVAWEVMLHPAQMFFETIAQGHLQFTYKPIFAGVRDLDPMSRKARDGSVTIFDAMDRGQRNSGIHAPMWFGDTATAQRIAKHLINMHTKVKGDLIDLGDPDLGGYEANSPRESMWAALTECLAMLWVYERLGWGTKRLTDAERDQYWAECAEYVRLFPHDKTEIPLNAADLRALYAKYERFFSHSDTVTTMPANGENWYDAMEHGIKQNFHRSQTPMIVQTLIQQSFALVVAGALSGIARRNMGYGPVKSRVALAARRLAWPLVGLMQWGPVQRSYMRLMWGPDAMRLIDSARELHAQARREGVVVGARPA